MCRSTRSPTLSGHQVARSLLRRDALPAAALLAFGGWGDDAFRDQAVEWTGQIEWYEPRNSLAVVRHGDLLASAHGDEIPAQMVS
jgi:hypothetical protein